MLCATDFPMVSPLPRVAPGTEQLGEGESVLPYGACDFDSAVSMFQRDVLRRALAKTSGNRTHAANLLGMKRTTLIAKLHGFEIFARTG
jgi:DNA-binding NtrC family response regulator